MRKKNILLVITLLLTSALAFYRCGGSSGSSGHVITGVLDTTFGIGGIVVHDNAAGGSSSDYGYSIALDNSGNIYVTGSSWNGSNLDMTIWKYTPAGILDTSFNGNGIAIHDNAAGGPSYNDSGYSIALDTSGNIYVTGYSEQSNSDEEDMVVWKYKPDGSRDTTFGIDGYVVHHNAAGGVSPAPTNDRGNSIALDNSGNIYVAGYSYNTMEPDIVIWKYTSKGILDTTFNNPDGFIVLHNIAGGSNDDYGNSIVLDNNGNIYVAGESRNASSDLDMVILKYTSTGIPDTTFNGTGIVVHNNAAGGSESSYDYGNSITIDNNGNLYVTGYSQNANGNKDMVIWKYTAAGVLDTSFNNTGIVVHDNAAGGSGNDYGNSIILDNSGKIYITGWSCNASGNDDMIIWKYTSKGILDTSFNNTGIVVHDNAAGGLGNDWGYSITLDNDDNLYVTGISESNYNYDMVIWNYK